MKFSKPKGGGRGGGADEEFQTCLANELNSLEFHFGERQRGCCFPLAFLAKYGTADPIAGYMATCDVRHARIDVGRCCH